MFKDFSIGTALNVALGVGLVVIAVGVISYIWPKSPLKA
jgi:hypothetical protein